MSRFLRTSIVSIMALFAATAHGQPAGSTAPIAPSSPPARSKPVANERFMAVSNAAATRFDQGRKWAVVVGVNQYLGEGIPSLEFCVADANLVAKQLVERCGYDEKRVLTLTDDRKEAHLRPLRINLDRQLRNWLSLAAAGDTVFVYFSGHGFLDERGQGFLAPQDCERNNLGLSAFRTDELRDMLRQCKATQKVLILDCCHAGGGKGDAAPSSSSQELGNAFKSASGLVTIASCRKSETSLEWKAKGQGVFTYFLSSGLGGAADFDRNGIVDNLELYRYVSDEVPTTAQRELNGVQVPVQIIGDDVAGVFALSRVAPPAALVEPKPLAEPIMIKQQKLFAITNKNGTHPAHFSLPNTGEFSVPPGLTMSQTTAGEPLKYFDGVSQWIDLTIEAERYEFDYVGGKWTAKAIKADPAPGIVVPQIFSVKNTYSHPLSLKSSLGERFEIPAQKQYSIDLDDGETIQYFDGISKWVDMPSTEGAFVGEFTDATSGWKIRPFTNLEPDITSATLWRGSDGVLRLYHHTRVDPEPRAPTRKE